MATVYARLIYQYEFKYETINSARFDKQGKDGFVLEQIELFNNLGFFPNLTLEEIDNNNVWFQFEH